MVNGNWVEMNRLHRVKDLLTYTLISSVSKCVLVEAKSYALIWFDLIKAVTLNENQLKKILKWFSPFDTLIKR